MSRCLCLRGLRNEISHARVDRGHAAIGGVGEPEEIGMICKR